MFFWKKWRRNDSRCPLWWGCEWRFRKIADLVLVVGGRETFENFQKPQKSLILVHTCPKNQISSNSEPTWQKYRISKLAIFRNFQIFRDFLGIFVLRNPEILPKSVSKSENLKISKSQKSQKFWSKCSYARCWSIAIKNEILLLYNKLHWGKICFFWFFAFRLIF